MNKKQKEIIPDIFETVRDFEKQNSFQVIYGAVTGSTARGIELPDSDLDSCFFYIDRTNPEKRHSLHDPKEKNSHRIKKDGKNGVCDVSFWELSSSMTIPKLQFQPSCTDEEHHLLQRFYLLWTSDHTFDPYGLQLKIMPVIRLLLFRETQMLCYLRQIEKMKDPVPFSEKKELKALYYAAALEYGMENRDLIPPHIQSVVSLLSPHRRQYILEELRALRDHPAEPSAALHRYVEDIHTRAKTEMKDYRPTDTGRNDLTEVALDMIHRVVSDGMPFLFQDQS